jgi:hypothetical protein
METICKDFEYIPISKSACVFFLKKKLDIMAKMYSCAIFVFSMVNPISSSCFVAYSSSCYCKKHYSLGESFSARIGARNVMVKTFDEKDNKIIAPTILELNPHGRQMLVKTIVLVVVTLLFDMIITRSMNVASEG